MFKRYPSLINTYRPEVKEFVEANADVKCYVTEKLHGANLSFHFDADGNVKVASRNQFVDESFYNAADVIEPIVAELKLSNHRNAIFYGELAGGNVQKGVDYGRKAWYLFDVFDTKLGRFFTPCELDMWCSLEINPDTSSIKRVPILDDNVTLAKALNMNAHFISLVVDKEDNYAEGFVICPVEEMTLPHGDRAIFKRKSEQFKEKSKATRLPKTVEITEEDRLAIEDASQYLNENRLQSVMSKDDYDIPKDIKKVAGLLVQDMISDYEASDSLSKVARRELNKLAFVLIKKTLMGGVKDERYNH